MSMARAVVNIPKHGRGAHPDNQSLAFDGRCRNIIAKAGAIDENEHQGAFYWLVQRTSTLSEANMVLEPITFEQKTTLTLPECKKRKVSSEWSSAELPAIPILVNRKAIMKHTQLCVFQGEKKKDPDAKQKQDEEGM